MLEVRRVKVERGETNQDDWIFHFSLFRNFLFHRHSSLSSPLHFSLGFGFLVGLDDQTSSDLYQNRN